tara:strand:+ start:3814 stop:4074 length:261 start_codon:yes stop_codon:yes gene_type:complete
MLGHYALGQQALGGAGTSFGLLDTGEFTFTLGDLANSTDIGLTADGGVFVLDGRILYVTRETATHRGITGTGFQFKLDDIISAGGS